MTIPFSIKSSVVAKPDVNILIENVLRDLKSSDSFYFSGRIISGKLRAPSWIELREGRYLKVVEIEAIQDSSAVIKVDCGLNKELVQFSIIGSTFPIFYSI